MLIRAFFGLCFRARIIGLNYLHEIGPRALIVPNHLSFLDAIMLGAYLPRKACYAVNTEISRLWWMKPAMLFFDAIAVDSTNPLAVRALIDKLRQDRWVIVFPEGRITVTGSLMKVYEGPAMIADKGDAPLVPIRLEGHQYTLFSKMKGVLKRSMFPALSLVVTRPKKLSVPVHLKGKIRRETLGRSLYDIMSEMIYETQVRSESLLHAIVESPARSSHQQPLIRDALGNSLSFSQLLKKSFVMGQVLPVLDSDQRRIGVLLPNGCTALLVFLALQWRGKVPAMLNFSHTPDQLESTQRVSLYRSVITSRKFVEMARLEKHIERLLRSGIQIQYLEDIAQTVSLFRKLVALVRYLVSSRSYLQRFSGDSEAVVLFTSGSEGSPKGVVLSHQNILSNIDQVTTVVPLHMSDRVFNALPMFHSFGLTGGTLMPLVKGVSVFLYPSPLHYRVIPEMIYNEGSTILFGTPTFLAGYARKAHPYDFCTLRYVFAGAERLAESVRAIYQERFGVRIFEGYGATETSPIISVNTPFYSQSGTVGRFVPGIEWRLEAVPGVAEGGRLFVKGANIMMGYLKADEPGELQPPHDGWYDTGDIVTVDAVGYVIVKGRAKRFAKIAGEMISLSAIEQIMERAFPNALHCVVAVADARKGERLVLYTTLKSADRALVSQTIRAGGLPELAIPRDVQVERSLPMLGSGKIDTVALSAKIGVS
jgi:acyl-[acyl-carrier-protein]-phospholipid O-acyltransferase/long-chain-fatty-acid--[acyl-carrier-protein] ligase